jgi:lipoate synthase
VSRSAVWLGRVVFQQCVKKCSVAWQGRVSAVCQEVQCGLAGSCFSSVSRSAVWLGRGRVSAVCQEVQCGLAGSCFSSVSGSAVLHGRVVFLRTHGSRPSPLRRVRRGVVIGLNKIGEKKYIIHSY